MVIFPTEVQKVKLYHIPLFYPSFPEGCQYVQHELLSASNLGPFLHMCSGWAETPSQQWLWLPFPCLSLCWWKSDLLKKMSECTLHKGGPEVVSGLECIVTRSCLKSQTSCQTALLGVHSAVETEASPPSHMQPCHEASVDSPWKHGHQRWASLSFEKLKLNKHQYIELFA